MDGRFLRLGLAGLLLAGLQACQTVRTGAAAPGAERRGAAHRLCRRMRACRGARWLGSLPDGTPVKVTGERDGSVQLWCRFSTLDAPAAKGHRPKPPCRRCSTLSEPETPAGGQAAGFTGRRHVGRPVSAIRNHLAGRGGRPGASRGRLGA
jgi:hypothetical protein